MEEAPVPIRSPGHHIDPDHRGPIIDILVWICFVFSSLAIVSKIILKVGKRTRYFRWSRLQVDDGAILLALAFSTAFSVCVSQQVRYGLGSHVTTLSPESLATSQKFGFAAAFMYISAICSANVCGIVFGQLLEPGATHRKFFHTLVGLTILWYLVSIIALAVQCNAPHRWQTVGNQCIDTEAFWASFDAVNAFLNLVITGALCTIVWALQTRRERYLLALLFGSRALIAVPMAFRIHYLFKYNDTPDPTMDLTDATITAVFLLHTTIVVTCVPFMKPVMEQLQSGWTVGAIRPTKGTQSTTEGTGWSGAIRYPKGFKFSRTTIETS